MLKEMAGSFKKSFEDILNFDNYKNYEFSFAGIGKIDDDVGKNISEELQNPNININKASNSCRGVEINNSSLALNVEEFETNISKLPVNIRVAIIIL